MVEINLSYQENETLKRLLKQTYDINYRIVENNSASPLDDYKQIIDDMTYIKRIQKKMQDAEIYFYDHLPETYY